MVNKTRIEWTDYSVNPVKGKCQRGCPYCYAIKMYNDYKWNPDVRFLSSELSALDKVPAGSKIFMCSTHEIFGSWIPDEWISEIIVAMGVNHDKTFQVLTKCPERVPPILYTDNVWVGTSIEAEEHMKRQDELLFRHPAIVNFISFEPLLGPVYTPIDGGIDWVIIGKETGRRPDKVIPKEEWIYSLMEDAEDRGIPVFLKNNLEGTIPLDVIKSRQKFPSRNWRG